MVNGGRGQSEVIGTALLLGITIISIALIVSIAGSALDSAQDTTNLESAEHAMSQLDSRAALVALGRTESQSVAMGRARDGSYRVDEDAGWLNITHVNYTGTDNHPIYNGTLGAIIYEHDGRTVAYQGGGVWRTDSDEGSVLVSPPEFHYRGETLTIPIIQVRSADGVGGASGDVTARLQRDTTSEPIYPHQTEIYPNGESYSNPIQNGSLRVTVHSRYYDAWGSFFRTRTEGTVTIDHSNETAIVELTVPSVEGQFDMPLDGDTLTLRGVGGKHAVTDLNFTLAPDDSDSASFSNLKWSVYAEDGSKNLELHIRGSGNPGCGDYVQGTVYYTDGSGTYEGWKNDTAFPVVCQDWDDDGDTEARVVANWSETTNFEYTSLSNSDLLEFSPSGSLKDPATFDHHENTVSWEPVTYNAGDQAWVNGTVSHYAAFFDPTLELTVSDSGGGGGASGSVNEGSSSGTVYFGGAGDTFVTYVHATENRVNVTLS